MITLSKRLSLLPIPVSLQKGSVYLAWIFNLLKYQLLGLFLESLTQKNFSIKIHQKIFFICTGMVTFIFCYSFIYQLIHQWTIIPPILINMFSWLPIYAPITIIPSLVITFRTLLNGTIPHLIRKQLKISYSMIIFPHIFFDLVQTFPLFFHSLLQDNIAGAILSNMFINTGFIFFAKRIFNFRFLNTTHHIETKNHFSNGHFKETIEQVSKASYIEELSYIIQNYFKEVFKIPTQNVCLHIRNTSGEQNSSATKLCKETQTQIEHFITQSGVSSDPISALREQKIIVLDEIEFNAFYTSSKTLTSLTNFLKSIDCFLFVPLFYKDELIAYITVKEKMHITFSISMNKMIFMF